MQSLKKYILDDLVHKVANIFCISLISWRWRKGPLILWCSQLTCRLHTYQMNCSSRCWRTLHMNCGRNRFSRYRQQAISISPPPRAPGVQTAPIVWSSTVTGARRLLLSALQGVRPRRPQSGRRWHHIFPLFLSPILSVRLNSSSAKFFFSDFQSK